MFNQSEFGKKVKELRLKRITHKKKSLQESVFLSKQFQNGKNANVYQMFII